MADKKLNSEELEAVAGGQSNTTISGVTAGGNVTVYDESSQETNNNIYAGGDVVGGDKVGGDSVGGSNVKTDIKSSVKVDTKTSLF